jgi:hypothetical protein
LRPRMHKKHCRKIVQCALHAAEFLIAYAHSEDLVSNLGEELLPVDWDDCEQFRYMWVAALP